MDRKEIADKVLALANEVLENIAELEVAEEIIKAVNYVGFDYELHDDEDSGEAYFTIFARY